MFCHHFSKGKQLLLLPVCFLGQQQPFKKISSLKVAPAGANFFLKGLTQFEKGSKTKPLKGQSRLQQTTFINIFSLIFRENKT